ncbi:zinc-dependent peptidase [Aestuariivivens sediminicola]|uniref:zinc-dependent peptidase n=1 Tax=Aestuariivivens sediminicola TaxID=2913560 RepID=UPI001F5680DC|nr:zinc-dependent peptidase [Aestuariivivens sediminicola]
MLLLLIIKYNLGSKIILGIFFAAMTFMFFYFAIKLVEMGYVLKKRKPYYVHFYFFKRKLSELQKQILKDKFRFYNKLSEQNKRYFEHRVASFIIDKDFIGRGGLVITEEMKVLLAATAVMLTFGFRDFYIGLISKIVVYPKKFYSKSNASYHKGEFNPKLKALVLSWEDFLKGFDVEDDNLNLGIHEFTHAIHINSIKERDISSTIFSDTFKELSEMLSKDDALRDSITSSKYFRKYAYTNQFEFLAVAIEHFIETPQDFKSEFPQVYAKVRQMLNFNYAGY